MKKYILFSVVMLSVVEASIFFSSCNNNKKPSPLKEGVWRGILTLNDSTGLIIPFNFDVTSPLSSDNRAKSEGWERSSGVGDEGGGLSFTIRNAEETISVDEISFDKDSVIIKMPVFDSEFRCKLTGDSLMTGNWINHSRKELNVIPFTAIYGETNRFDCPEFDENFTFEGKWECIFSPNMPDSSYAIGVFKQSGSKATGTFLTETGDYRYLEGCVFGKYMLLSSFDGAHAYVFHAEIMEDSTIWGEFYSGIHHHETWLGNRNESFQLRNADSLTFLKPGFSKVDFTFPSLGNDKVSFSDDKYKNKVVILQLMGSWCPNCMDETKFLSELNEKYKAQGLEIIGLAFEKSFADSTSPGTSFEKAKSNVLRLKNKFNADYEFLITGFPPKDAAKAMPMLNHVMSFPTTIFIDKKGAVRKIHTGYSGPAAGGVHEKFKTEITSFIEGLLKE